MAKILWLRRVTYATVSSPSDVTILLSSVTIAICFLESSWKYPFQKYCLLFTSLHRAPFAATLWRQTIKWWLYKVVTAFVQWNLGETFLYHLYLQNASSENIWSLCHVISTPFLTLNKWMIIITVILSVIIECTSVPGW